MQTKTILIVEDEEPIQEMMKSILEIEGYSVLAVANGKEAITAVQAGTPFSLILLDMMMPVMNGWEVLDFLRSNAMASQIPVVIVSAYGEIAKSVKPQAIVPKPIQLNTLLNTIEKLCA